MIPLSFKHTRSVDVQTALFEHIRQSHQETHPEAFKWDAEEWQRLRNAYERVVNGTELHILGTETISRYYAQLTCIVTKLPNDIGLQFLYEPADNERKPLVLPNIAFERYCVLYNLGVFYNKLANLESRTNANSIKQASNYYQIAAGTFSVLRKNALPAFSLSLEDGSLNLPPEFDADYISGMENLMLAQAQEAAWQLATLPGTQYKNAVVARISKSVSVLYFEAQAKFNMFPTRANFLSSVELQALHFSAVCQYRKSEDDHDAHRFGEQLVRLDIALRQAKKAVQHAKSYQLTYVTGKTFVETLDEAYTRSKKDNDYIYNQNPPAESHLPEIQEFSMVKSIILEDLSDPKKAVKHGRTILGELLPWGACVAFDLYEDRKENWIREMITEPLKALELAVSRTLTELGLPASLDALNKPTGLPPSLLRKAEEVRLGNGPENLRVMCENFENLYKQDTGILDEALDFLDQEATEDEIFRTNHPITASKHTKEHSPSHEANVRLISKSNSYRETLDKGMEGNSHIQDKLDEYDDDISLLSLPQNELESIVPNSTGGAANSKSTLVKAREIRALLEQQTDFQQNANSILSRADHQSRTDKRPRLTAFASSLDMWAQVDTSMFEPVIEEELGKYNRFKEEAVELENLVNEVLDKIKDRNERFIASRKDDPSVKARERMLQKLDVAYTIYKELLANLEEGLKFYNDMTVYLNSYKEECKQWVYERRYNARSLVATMESLSLDEPELVPIKESDPNTPQFEEEEELYKSQEEKPQLSEVIPNKTRVKGTPSGLPPPPSLYSGGWEKLELPQPPQEEPVFNSTPKASRSTRKAKVASALH